MQAVWRMHAADTDALFFLGDGYRDLELLKPTVTVPLYAVKGNNDFYSPYPIDQTVEFDGKRILLTHGHQYYVKSHTRLLIAKGIARGADAVLFGHTHTPTEEYLPADVTGTKPLYVFGCGSIGLPNGTKPAYGILETYRDQMILIHATLSR